MNISKNPFFIKLWAASVLSVVFFFTLLVLNFLSGYLFYPIYVVIQWVGYIFGDFPARLLSDSLNLFMYFGYLPYIALIGLFSIKIALLSNNINGIIKNRIIYGIYAAIILLLTYSVYDSITCGGKYCQLYSFMIGLYTGAFAVIFTLILSILYIRNKIINRQKITASDIAFMIIGILILLMILFGLIVRFL